jgi:secreted PhoX family phosphatase
MPVAPGDRSVDLSALGPLREPDALGLALPAGLTARIVALSGERPARGASVWHPYPDGGATFASADGGWVYVNNSEAPMGAGGASALRFDRQGNVVGAQRVLDGTTANCAGGATPWGTWLSAEETTLGRVWECQPFGEASQAEVRPALGVFKHEAVAVDPQNRTLYLTEDDGQGRFYRFVCSASDWPAMAARPALKSGRLQVLQMDGVLANQAPPEDMDLAQARRVSWVDVSRPSLPQSVVRGALGAQAPGTVFRGGEGLWFFRGVVYFSTKGDNRIWALDVASQRLQVIYDFATASPADRVLSGVDNLTVSARGDVLVAEDGGNMELCVILPDRRVKVLLRLHGQEASEITGPAFSPDGRRLYFNSQRGGRQGLGITYEVTLPA